MQDPLVWIDLEMTGLDPETDVILEIAVVVTDGALEEIVPGPQLVLAVAEQRLAAMDPVVAKMHRLSGLTAEAREAVLTVQEAERRVLEFVRSQVPESGTAPLAGNTVHVDRAFLRRYLPAVESWLHYRNVDVSTLKELVRRWAPERDQALPHKEGTHRALSDVMESIEELRAYKKLLFGQDPG